MNPESYLDPGALTALSPEHHRFVDELLPEPGELCRAAQRLLVLPPSSSGTDLSDRRLNERNLRPAGAIFEAGLQRDDRPLSSRRARKDRVTGTCRHFAVLSCAFLRARNISARARCGFATYFKPGLALDHWVTEYWNDTDRRWIRIDSEILDLDVIDNPHDLVSGQFLTGPEAWSEYRRGADPGTFGVDGTGNWGIGEIIGNSIRDLASLNRVEMLPWDEWGPMRDCYDGTIALWVEQLMDDFAAATLDKEDGLAELYARVEVPSPMIG
ncbi:MAG: hypothetical protein QOI61_1505 [Actinomycetota bacterium]|jgi:hypothetical protein